MSDVETLNHMYGTVQAMGNELLDALKVQVSPSEPRGSPKEEVPKESPKKEETMEKKVVVLKHFCVAILVGILITGSYWI